MEVYFSEKVWKAVWYFPLFIIHEHKFVRGCLFLWWSIDWSRHI